MGVSNAVFGSIVCVLLVVVACIAIFIAIVIFRSVFFG
jgi:hypothetical protein